MKIVLMSIMFILGLNACASHSDNAYYDRANKASEKAHKEFH